MSTQPTKMKYSGNIFFHVFLSFMLAATSCNNTVNYKNPILPGSCYPQATLFNGMYYFVMQDSSSCRIVLSCTDDLTKLATCERQTVWKPADPKASKNIWSPELHLINNIWYIYFEADDGNTDNHQLYVLENKAANPMEGTFRLKSRLTTNAEWNWSIHPTTFQNKGVQYLVWSGWPKRRAEEETQCIYIARMENPWTIGTERVLISRPDYEWERQWIDPDGSRSAYPIYVNESPHAFFSKDQSKVIICYSASGCWTLYNAVGMLYADADSDLLNPESWHKSDEPVFTSAPENNIYGPSDICTVPSIDGSKTYLLYDAKQKTKEGTVKSIYMQELEWDEKGMPVFGKPQKPDDTLQFSKAKPQREG